MTGMGLVSPIGHAASDVARALQEDRHGIAHMSEWAKVGQLETRLAAPIRDLPPRSWPRKKVRTMGRVGLLATHATEAAVEESGLTPDYLRSGEVGLAYGSTHGSSSELESFCTKLFRDNSFQGLASSTYLKFMSHTCAANLALFYGIRGRIITTCSACVSGSQAIGYGYEAVRSGIQEVMICGGAEELHFIHAGVFDIMYATSTRYNDRPECSPRPFDADRDGLVVGEGAGTLVLESYERARERGAHIHGEIVGFGTNCDGGHVTAPSRVGMAGAMRLALRDAGSAIKQIDYVNAHATATEIGDVCESGATLDVVGDAVPISSTKGFTGHTLGASGALEAIFCLAMIREGFLAPSRGLDNLDPACAPLSYVRGDARAAKVQVAMTNNFAFGGINTSLVIAKV